MIAGLALIGGLAAACFTKAFGIVFLGEPRSDHAAHAHEPGLAMRLPMFLLAASCLLIGLLAPSVVGALIPVLKNVTNLPRETIQANLDLATGPLLFVAMTSLGLFGLIAVLAGLRRLLGRQVEGGDLIAATPAPPRAGTPPHVCSPADVFFMLSPRSQFRRLGLSAHATQP